MLGVSGGNAGDGRERGPTEGKRLVRGCVYCEGSTRREYAGRGSVFVGRTRFAEDGASLGG